MKRLLLFMLLMSPLAFSQGNAVFLTGSGAPSGNCAFVMAYIDSSTGTFYSCNGSGSWVQVGPGAAGATSLNSVTDPATNKAFSMGTNTLVWNWTANSSTSNLFSVSDFATNTGTGYLFTISSGSSSAAKPFRACYRGTTDCVVLNTTTLTTSGAAVIDATKLSGNLPALNGSALTNITLASSQFANQGTTTTVLHGNAAGNPSFGQIVNADITNATINVTTKITGIVPGANGGTGNGFFAVGGPTTSLKTFTFPDASATVLTDNALVAVAQGGTGAGTLTGLIKGSGTSPLSAAAAADVYGLWSGSCDATKALWGDGSCKVTIQGTLASTQVAFGSGTNTVSGSANFVYSSSAGISLIGGANNVDVVYAKRSTDTTPTGNFLHFQNNGTTADLFKVDITGAVTGTSYSTSNPSGLAGMISMVQGTAPSNVANAVNLLAPTSVTTYSITFPSTIAAGLMRLTSGGVMSFAELSGDATTSASNAVTVVKVNGVAYPTTGSSFDAIPILTASNSVSYVQINGGSDCGSSTTALKYTQSTHTFGCQTITAAAPGAGGSTTQVQFNSANALAGSANLTWVSPVLTVGATGVTGQVSFAGSTSGATAIQAPAVASGTLTLPAATDTLVGKATTDTLTNKTFDTAGTGNSLKINGTAVSAITGSGSVVLATSPSLTTPNLGTPSALTLTNAIGLPGAGIVSNSVTATQLAAQYSKGSCTEVWGGSGTSFALTSGDDAVSNNTCYNDSGVTRTITAVKCRSDNASNTTTVNPTFGAAGTGTTILSGALTCGSSLAYSSSGTVSNASWTTGTGITPAMGGTLTGTSIALIVEYTF